MPIGWFEEVIGSLEEMVKECEGSASGKVNRGKENFCKIINPNILYGNYCPHVGEQRVVDIGTSHQHLMCVYECRYKK